MEHDPSRAQWRKSSHSGNTGNCVEVAHLGQVIGVRDSKSLDKQVLFIACGQWCKFIDSLKGGRFGVVLRFMLNHKTRVSLMKVSRSWITPRSSEGISPGGMLLASECALTVFALRSCSRVLSVRIVTFASTIPS